MAKSTKLSLLGLLAFVGLLVVLGLLLPRGWQASSTIEVSADPAVVHAMVADFRNWEHWAGWNTRADPALHIEFTGPGQGKGAVMSWDGPRIGDGRIEITEADPRSGIRYTATIRGNVTEGEIKLEATEEGTRVTWTNRGKAPPVYGPYFVPYYEEAWTEQQRAGLQGLKQLLEPKDQ